MKKLLLIFCIISLLLVGCDTGKAVKEGNTDTNTETKKETKQEVFKVGDNINFDKVVYTVNGVRDSAGNEFEKPKEGSKFILIDITIENKSDKTQNISSMLMFKLLDSKAFNYNPTFISDQKGSLDAEITVSAKLRGEIAFEVPKEETQLKLDVDPSIFGTGKFTVELY